MRELRRFHALRVTSRSHPRYHAIHGLLRASGAAGGGDLVGTFDPAKDQQNIVDRGLSFKRADDFDWSTAVIESDRRSDYGEPRFRAYGFLDGRLHALVFTPRDDDIRVISFRRANRREQAAYAKEARPLPPR